MMGQWVLDPEPSRGQWVLDDEQISVKAGKAVNSIPRQLGLTARYAMEGPAQAAQIFTEPVAALMRSAGIKTKSTGALATGLADWIGLPTPQGANERVIGDATRLVAGAGGFGSAARAASTMPEIAGKVFTGLASNPMQQLSSAAGAGLAGGASREAGGGDLMQAGASLMGGVSGGLTPGAISGVVNTGRRMMAPTLTAQQLDIKLTETLGKAGADYSKLPEQVQRQLRAELAESLQAGKQLDPQSVSRLADFKATGATPTRGMISQNPVQITREMNLAKIGANSNDDVLQGLAMTQNRNNARLIENLNTLGAGRGDVQRAGETVTGSIFGRQAGLRGSEQSLWDTAKASPGYKQPIGGGVLSDVNAALDSEGLMPFMNPTISRYMAAFQTGQPFTPQAYKNLQSMLSKETMKGGNEGAAASLAAKIMRESDLKPAGFQSSGNALVTQGMASGMREADNAATGAIDAVNAARRATRAAYSYEDSSPLVKSVLSDGRTSDPMRIAQSYIIGGTAKEAADVIQQVGPQGMAPIKEAILGHLKAKALSGASDETGKFSQSAFTQALNAMGKQKLALIFTPEELRALNTNARVASLMMSQPVGSAVNNSNSGALLLGRGSDMLGALAKKMPFGQQLVADPLRNMNITLSQRQAANYLPGLLTTEQRDPWLNSLMLPGMAAGGGLLSP